MRTRQHGYLCPIEGQAVQLIAQRDHVRQVPLEDKILHQQRQRRVVHILAGEAEVHEFLLRTEPGVVEQLLQEILHGFHVVVGGALDLLDALGIMGAQLRDPFPHTLQVHRPRSLQFG